MIDGKTKIKLMAGMLVDARSGYNISLEEASKDLNIPFRYLESLEHNTIQNIPADDFERMLKKYCGYLGVDFSLCLNSIKMRKKSPKIKKAGNIERKYLFSWPAILRRAFIIVIVLAVLVFFGIKVEQIFTPPTLNITYPQDGSVIESKHITISGKSEPEVELVVNNKEIFVSSDGSFSAEIDLQKGLNLIKITAKKRYSRSQEKEIRLLFKN